MVDDHPPASLEAPADGLVAQAGGQALRPRDQAVLFGGNREQLVRDAGRGGAPRIRASVRSPRTEPEGRPASLIRVIHRVVPTLGMNDSGVSPQRNRGGTVEYLTAMIATTTTRTPTIPHTA